MKLIKNENRDRINTKFQQNSCTVGKLAGFDKELKAIYLQVVDYSGYVFAKCQQNVARFIPKS